MKRDFFFIWSTFYKYLNVRMYVSLILSLLSGAMEVFGIILLFPIMGLLAETGSSSVVSDTIEAALKTLEIELTVANLSIILVVMFALRALLMFGALTYSARLRTRFVRDLRLRLLNYYASSGISLLEQRQSGNLVNLISEQCNRSLTAFWLFNQSMMLFSIFAVYLFASMFISPLFSLISIMFASLILIVFKKFTAKINALSLQLAELNGGLSNYSEQFFRSFKYLSFTKDWSVLVSPIERTVKDIEKRQFISGRLLALSDSLKEPMIITMLVSVILFMYYFQGIDISSVIISVALLYRASTSLSRCQGQWQKAMEWFGSFANIDNEFLFLQTASHNVERQEVREVTSFKLENVGYAYEGMPQEIFSNVSCIIEKPSLTVVKGSSGSGKSTLMDLLCGLRTPTSGTVTVVFDDNSSLDPSQVNIKVGYVGQNCLIFDGDIISNVSLKANNTTAEVKRICEILRSVGLERWANEDKSGIYMHVTNSSSVLSGGERQRLAIAREIYRSPHIFVFDEPTSSLDSVATLRINELIDRLAAEHIVVVISHKNDIFQQASNVLLISNPKNSGEG